VRVLSSCAGVAGAAAALSAASAAAASGQGGEASRFAPSLAGASPRRDNGDLGGKRAKVGSGIEPVDQFPRRGQGQELGLGGGSARGSESDAPTTITGLDNDGFADAEDERHHHHKKKKDKKDKKMKKNRDFIDSSDERGAQERQNLNHSQSEPAVISQNRSAAPPPEAMEARGLGGGPYPTVPHNFPESESLSQVGRARVKAGIRLQPLQPIIGGASGGGMPSASGMEASSATGLHMSSSVPELKPLDKLQPL